MSSLRLAIQQSLQEAGEGGPAAPKRDRRKKKKKNRPLAAVSKPPRKPGDPPRKRGRPRKHPLPLPSPPQGNSADDGDPSSSNGEEENEFESEEENSSSSSDGSGTDDEERLRGDQQDSDDDNDNQRNAHRDLHQKKVNLNSAANKIQHQWKRKQKKAPKDDDDETKTPVKSKGSAKKSASKSTVQPPAPDLMEWKQGLPIKKQKRSVCSGLRVKVRFETKVRKRDGRIVRKRKWYGGLVTAVSTGGSKIRIKYDDGTSEVTKFPDADIVVDAEGNGAHRASAAVFEVPEPKDEQSEDDKSVVVGDEEIKNEDEEISVDEGVKSAPTDETTTIATFLPSITFPSKEKESARVKEAETDEKTTDDSAEDKPSEGGALEKKKPKLKLRLHAPKRKRESAVEDRSNDSDDESKSGGRDHDVPSSEKETDVSPQLEASTVPVTTGNKRSREEDSACAEAPPVKKVDVKATTRDEAETEVVPTEIPDPREESTAEGGEPSEEEPLIDGSGDMALRDANITERNDGPAGGEIAIEGGFPPEDSSQPLSAPLKSAESLGPPSKDAKSSAAPVELVASSAKAVDESETAPAEDTAVNSSVSSMVIPHEASPAKDESPVVAPSPEETRERKVMTPIPDLSSFMDEAYSPVPRSGRRAAQQANERIAARQEIVIQDPYAKKKRKREKQEKATSATGEAKRRRAADDSDDEDDREWVQCDKCLKWRILPSNVQTQKLPKHWYCEMNIYDALRNSCDAQEQTLTEIKKERRKAKRKAARLARKQAEHVGSMSSDAEFAVKKGKKERNKEGQSVRSPVNEKSTLKLQQKGESAKGVARVGPVTSMSQSPTSDVETRKPLRKQSSSASLGGKRSKHTDDEAELDVALDSGVTKSKGRGRQRGRASKDFSGKGRGEKIGSQSQDPDNQEWVMCEKCSKWRRLPPHISADSLPDVWYCSMNTWNVASASCQAAEDKADPNTLEFGIYGSGVSTAASGNKLSYRNLIFGAAGKKQNRPISERTRAAESLFAPADDPPGEGCYPKAMYANSSVYVPRGIKAGGEERSRVSIFDIMDRSKLWAELRSASIMQDALTKPVPAMYRSRDIDYSFSSVSPETRRILKEIVLRSLGAGTRAGHEVLLEAQCRKWNDVPESWSFVRPYCTVHNVVESLLELASEGRVEIVRPTPGSLLSPLPKYRAIAEARSDDAGPETDNTVESPRNSRCIKIAKPWKQGLPM